MSVRRKALHWLLPLIIGLLAGAIASSINHIVLSVWEVLRQDGIRNRSLFFIYGMTALILSYLIIHALSRTRTPQSSFHTILEVYHLSPIGIRAKEALIRTSSAISTLVFGGASGPEGPAAIAGGGLGSLLARLTSFDARKAFLIGVSAGIAASFRAPFTGILLALELPYRKDLEVGVLAEATLASVSAYLISILLNTPYPVLPGAQGLPLTLLLPTALGIGVVLGVVARGFIKAYHIGEALAKRLLARGGYPFMVLIGGLGLGLAGFLMPDSVGPGYFFLANMSKMTSLTLLATASLRTLATILTLSYGGSGGLFLPTMAIGAGIGGFIAWVIEPSYLPIFALLGMAAFSAGVHKVILAPAVFIAELMGSELIIPALLASVTGFFVSGQDGLYHIQPQSRAEEEELALERFYRKVRMLRPKEIEEIRVRDVMTRSPVKLYSDMTVRKALELFMSTPFRVLPVVERPNRLLGYVNLEELAGLPKKALELRLDVIGLHRPLTLYADEKLVLAIEKMVEKEADHAFVVDERDNLIGVVSSIDIVRILLRHYTKL